MLFLHERLNRYPAIPVVLALYSAMATVPIAPAAAAPADKGGGRRSGTLVQISASGTPDAAVHPRGADARETSQMDGTAQAIPVMASTDGRSSRRNNPATTGIVSAA